MAVADMPIPKMRGNALDSFLLVKTYLPKNRSIFSKLQYLDCSSIGKSWKSNVECEG
jgi:hypothetical protein